jgi:hypothetical protein
MDTTDIPRYFPCRLQADSLDYGANFACIEVPINGARSKALLMFSTRERAGAFIEESGDKLEGWIVAYMGYDVMAPWLRRAATVSEAKLIVIDIRASGLHPTHVTNVDNVLTMLDACDTESGEALSVEAETYSL